MEPDIPGALAAHPLNDARVRIQIADVGFTLRANHGGFDVVLLDVDQWAARVYGHDQRRTLRQPRNSRVDEVAGSPDVEKRCGRCLALMQLMN
jgi:predicted membrane-bound spermidine synthase